MPVNPSATVSWFHGMNIGIDVEGHTSKPASEYGSLNYTVSYA